jgi:non-lysosomal glucosylceramidase
VETRRDDPTCQDPSCGCGTGPARPNRREFVQLIGLGAAAMAAQGVALPTMAGPFDDVNEYLQIIPRDKRLDPRWVASLFARGAKPTYHQREALGHVGMPVGGLFAGTVYLSGDGRLWLWDVFNNDPNGIAPRTVQYHGQGLQPGSGANYVSPAKSESPFKQGFALDVGGKTRTLDATGFSDVTFDGRYPIGRVTFRDPACPVTVALEAFSPFCPMELDDSSLPVTVMSYTVTNPTDQPVTCALRGWLENPVAAKAAAGHEGQLVNRVAYGRRVAMVVASAEPVEPAPKAPARPDIEFADFESETYGAWTTEGTAFGSGPIEMAKIPAYQGDVGGHGKRVVNSHATAPGGPVGDKDSAVGTLTSPPFTIERHFIAFLIGGGDHAGETCLNLLVDGKVMATATGHNDNRMAPASFAVKKLAGKTARLQVVDKARGGWGNIGVDHIVFTDRGGDGRPLAEQPDFGTMALGVLGRDDELGISVRASAEGDRDGGYDPLHQRDEASKPLGASLVGGVQKAVTVPAGGSTTVNFLLAWHFPNYYGRGVGGAKVGHSYATRFRDAVAVADYVAEHFDRLAGQTRAWVETWYDSTLPYWLLDRTMANTSTLATTTCYRFHDGRFWAWEGIGCCEGTCTHVWQYAQAPGRLFPALERDQRRRVDFGLALHPDGGIGMRAGLNGANEPAHDGQCGRILGAYREHQMSTDGAFLAAVWPNVKKAIEYMIAQDGNGDGLVEGPQPNTLDADWYGKISFLASLYLAALRAGEAMAGEVGDAAFARRCRTIADRGAQSILGLFNGDYFYQIEDPKHANEVGVGTGCYIDQVFGQTWAHWVGLGTLFDRQKQLTALRALWSYNFVPDVGPFRARFKQGRWYAVAGDAGLLMATWPRGGENPRFKGHWQYQYFNECMSGFEWQAAAHMVYEGHDQPDLLEHGLAVARAIHDRYDARLRNPYNEVECSDHYSRAMASYGVFLAVCGYEHHGPKGHLGFAPRLSPDDFRCAFTAADCWGTFTQSRTDAGMTADVRVRHGQLKLETLALVPRDTIRMKSARVELAGAPVAATLKREGSRVVVATAGNVTVKAGQVLRVVVS